MDSQMPFGDPLKKMAKLAVGLGAVALIGYLLYAGITSIYHDAAGMHPHPTDPTETASKFFYCLWDRDYQGCYKLLAKDRKLATIIGKQDRKTGYEPHFERIRNYLSEKVGPDFDEIMKVEPGGQVVNFGVNVVLTLSFSISKGFDKKNHYGIEQINEFPIDVAPGIGIEAYNRRVNSALGSESGLPAAADSDDPSEILRDRDGESSRQREERVIEAFKVARQLDTREVLLSWIIREFGGQRLTQKLLRDIVDDEKQPPQLRLIADEGL